MMTTFPEFLRRRRAELGLMQRRLAEAIGVDVPMYSRFEHGERRPKREQVIKLARLLDVDANELVALWLAQQAHDLIASDSLKGDAAMLLQQMLGVKTPAPAEQATVAEVKEEQPTAPAIQNDAADHKVKRDLVTRAARAGRLPHFVTGDAAAVMDSIEDASIACIVTTPPYWALRDGGNDGINDITADGYLEMIAAMARQARRVLAPSGSMWLNLAGGYDAQAAALPERVIAMLVDKLGWTVRDTVVWQRQLPGDHPASGMRSSHERLYLLTPTNGDFYFNDEALRKAYSEMTPIKQGVYIPNLWTIPYKRGSLERYHVAPEQLYRLPVLATCPPDGIVLDPYCGTGTACTVAYGEGRRSIGIDINSELVQRARRRNEPQTLSLFG